MGAGSSMSPWHGARLLRGTMGSSYLLLNFSGCFSRMTWKRWAMEASCSERERRDVGGAAGK